MYTWKNRIWVSSILLFLVTMLEELKRTLFKCLDCFHQELSACFKAACQIILISLSFSQFLWFLQKKNFRSLPTIIEIHGEFSGEDILAEIFWLWKHLEAAKIDPKETNIRIVLQLLKLTVTGDFYESLPNLSSCLRFPIYSIYLSVDSWKRNFSKWKLIVCEDRSTNCPWNMNMWRSVLTKSFTNL